MHVMSSTCGSRGNVKPTVGLTVKLRTLGAEVRACAPQGRPELPGNVGVPLMPIGVWR